MNKKSLISIIAFLLVTFGAVTAQPDKAVPSARAYSSIAQAEAHVPAIVIKNGTTDLPLVVQVQPTPEEEQRNNLDKRTRAEAATNDRLLITSTASLATYTNELKTWTAVLAIVTFGLLLASGIQIVMFLRQLRFMREGLKDAKIAAEAARDSAGSGRASADIAKTAMEASERAYVNFSGCRWVSHRHLYDKHIFWRIRPLWINTGNTPTRQLTVTIWYRLLEAPLPDNFEFPADREGPVIPAMIPPKGIVESAHYDIDGTDLQAVRAGAKHFYLFGLAQYRDVFQNTQQHLTRFSVKADNITGDPLDSWDDKTNPVGIMFQNYGRYNCADEDCQ